MPERQSINSFESEYSKLTGSDKFRIVLKMFGTKSARENFIKLCQEYYKLRTNSKATADRENYRRGPKVSYSTPKRAEVHNKIMETLKRLATDARLNQEQ